MNELPPWLGVLYPFSGNAYACSEGTLNYVDEGGGPAVVMLHGNPTWSFFYRDLILEMRGRNRCLALDHLGCGLSEKPQDAPYTLEAHIRRATRWIESLGLDSFHLVVHDWGGAIGFGVARHLKEKVRCITILNTAAFPFPSIPLRIAACRLPLLGTPLVRGANLFVEAATRMTTVKPLSDAVKDGYRYPYTSWDRRIAIDRFVKDIPMSRDHPSRPELEAVSSSLEYWRERPVQVMWGMQDWCFSVKILEEWERRLPRAAVHRMEGAGHYLMEDAGERIYPLIRDFDAAHP